jgi:hypothetical protein
MTSATEKPVPAAPANEPEIGSKATVRSAAGEATISMLRPSGLTGISILERVELRNYVYRINGRY